MADIYEVVNCYSLNARNKPSMKGTPVKWYKKGNEVRVYKTSGNWCNTSSTKEWWVYNKYIKKIGSDTKKTETKKETTVEDTTTISKENMDVPADDTLIDPTTENYDKLLRRYVLAFGSPPKYTKRVDPYYTNTGDLNVGRSMLNTWYSDPAIFSICPGTVDYLPGFSSSDKDKFWDAVVGHMTGDIKSLATADRNLDLNGKLYAFKSAYTDYINVVNLLARLSANYLGIGDVNNIILGSSVPLKKFDYGWYTNGKKSKSSSSIFSETKNALNTAVSDGAYIHFFVNHSGVNINESMTTSSGQSALESLMNESKLSSIQQNLQFMLGGAIGDSASKDIDEIIADANKSNSFLGSFATLASNYLKGGRLVFPQMITGVGYDKAINVQLQFTSIYGDRRSIFKYTILPVLHLLALASPKQLSDSMYTYPYLCRVYQKGVVNCDLAYISNLELKRGGSDETSWTVDGLATEITATFTVTPLYSNMMVTSARNPFLAMNNTALMEYLGTLCGVDLKANNFNAKVSIAVQMLKNYVTDLPINMFRGITDKKLINELRNFLQITN